MSTFTGDSRLATELMYSGRKPVGKVRLSSSSLLSKDLVYYHLGRPNFDSKYALFSKGVSVSDVAGSSHHSVTSGGQGSEFSSHNDYIRHSISTPLIEYTYLCTWYPLSFTSEEFLISSDKDNSSREFQFRTTALTSSTAQVQVVNWDAVQVITNSVVINSNEANVAAFSINQEKQILSVNGVTEELPYSSSVKTNSYFSICQDRDVGIDGVYLCCAVWGRAFSFNELSSLTKDPYQLVIPDIGA